WHLIIYAPHIASTYATTLNNPYTQDCGTLTMTILFTGAHGIVRPHLVSTLRRQFGDDVEILATTRMKGVDPVLGTVETLDVTDARAVYQLIRRVRPSHVVHLAGLAAIRVVIADTSTAWQIHLFGTLNIANALLEHAPDC